MITTNRDVVEAIQAVPVELERVAAELRAGLSQFQGSTRLQAARVVPVGAAGGRDLVSAGEGRLLGWSLRATDDHVTVALRNSRGPSGDLIGYVELPATSTVPAAETVWFGPGGVSFTEGVYVEIVTTAGTCQGVVYLGAVD